MTNELTRLEHRDDGIALILIDNPPVNALGAEVIAGLCERLAVIDRDDSIRAVVLCGANGTFSGGADIREFGKPPGGGPTLRDAIEQIEAARVPFVAALQGHALGGGLELALACDYRIALPGTFVAQPEIKLGLIPGAGGTQRLPRLIGLEAALEMIEGGELVTAERAKTLGLIDAVGKGDLIESALLSARECATLPRRRTSSMPIRGDAAVLDAARLRAPNKERGGLAAHLAVDAIEAGLRLPFPQALLYEREIFEELRASEQSKARIHVFFAEREASRVPDIPEARAFSVRTAGVVGGGTMGTGIAMALANAGINVVLIDVSLELIDRARATIEGNYDSTLSKGKITQAEADERFGRIKFSTWLEAAADADLVIEAVFEEMDLKQDVFRKLDHAIGVDTILATNTSTLDVDAIASVTRRPDEVCGMHFFSPANVMKLLEIVRGKFSSPATIGKALAFARQIRKIGVVAGNCDGFIGNRMLAHYKREAEFLLEEGASPQQVDRVIRDFGFPMGPFAMSDLAGLDVSWRIRKRRYAERPPSGRYPRIADRLCEMGRFGQKTGDGFYHYFQGDRKPIPDPAIDKLIEEVAADANIPRRVVHDAEILKRCIYPLINEAANILLEGIATRPGDVDVVWVYGYGFPNWRGGPLRYADTIGTAKLVEELHELERAHGPVWTPSPLLQEMAIHGGTFATLHHHRAAEWAMR